MNTNKRTQTKLKLLGYYNGAVDGIVGPKTRQAIETFTSEFKTVNDQDFQLTLNLNIINKVKKMFPAISSKNIELNCIAVVDALIDDGITSPKVIIAALATIRAEVESFAPVNEGVSKYNTRDYPFDLYDNRRDLGNTGHPDGELYKGRGYIQLTGRANYQRIGKLLNIDLESAPRLALSYAPKILSKFILGVLPQMTKALEAGKLRTVRKLVNGGSHGLDRFMDAYNKGIKVFNIK